MMVNQRANFYPPDEICAQVQAALETHEPGKIDWVTFVGSGETTLHAGLGEMVRTVKGLTDLPVAVITNGSLLYLPEVREALLPADAVLPSLDAGNADLYRRINRQHPDLTFQRLVDGLKLFREEYANQLWIEVMLVRGMNDSEAALMELATVLAQIRPDEVHLVQPTRPPVESWVEPPDEDGVLRARAILGKVARIIHPATGVFDLSGAEDLLDAIMGILIRHPMKESELKEALNAWPKDEVGRMLERLEQSGRAKIIERQNVRFWRASEAVFPDREGSDGHADN